MAILLLYIWLHVIPTFHGTRVKLLPKASLKNIKKKSIKIYLPNIIERASFSAHNRIRPVFTKRPTKPIVT